MAQALGLPLYRAELIGGSVNQSLVYDTTPGDEIEDLFALIQRVKADFPGTPFAFKAAICALSLLKSVFFSSILSSRCCCWCCWCCC